MFPILVFRGYKVGKYRKLLRHRLKHVQCVGLTCLMFIFSQSWSWICLLSTMFTLENRSLKPYEDAVYDMKNLVGLFCHMQCITMLISHVHMITFTYMVYVYIHVFVYTWPYICNIWTYTYINSPWIYDLVFHRLAFSLYTVFLCERICIQFLGVNM